MHTRSLCLLAAVLGLLASALAGAQEARSPEQPCITEAMRREDPRLEKPVTLSERLIVVGDALVRLGEQAGVALSAGERDGAADVSLALFRRDQPLARILNGIWSLLSYRGAAWRWERAGGPGRCSYRLTQPRAARELGPSLTAWVQARLEAHAQRLLDAADETETQRAQALRDVYGTDDMLKVAACPTDRFWLGVRAFRDLLTPAEKASLLRRDQLVVIPKSRAGPEWCERITSACGDGQNPPNQVAMAFMRARGVSAPLVVALFPGIYCPQVFGGVPLNEACAREIDALWQLDGDVRGDAAMARPIAARSGDPGPSSTAERDGGQWMLRRLGMALEAIAEGARVPVLARLPEGANARDGHVPDVRGRTLREVERDLWREPWVMKWRDRVLLMSARTWPLNEAPVPQWLVHELRRHARPGEYLPFDDLTTAADLLGEYQLKRLAWEFPVMERVASARHILAPFRRFPALWRRARSAAGLPITPEVAAALRPLMPANVIEVFDRGEPAVLRVGLLGGPKPEEPARRLTFELRALDGRFLVGHYFEDRCQPLPEEKPSAK
ncbi:MAG: hypothetical protein IT208_11330 [Chthonomonadales bacterium]|nr:hypothetical protein [Chthonomonadales bacterium]